MSRNTAPTSEVMRSKQVTKAVYDRLSKWYDTIAGSYSSKFREKGLQKLNARKGETVLEIGFGTGHCIKALAESVGDAGKVYGFDISEGMRDVTQSRIAKACLAGRVELRLGDAVRLPFEDNLFDAIFSSFTLEMFEAGEIPIVLNQCWRVLKTGGRLGVVSLSKRVGKNNWMPRLYQLSYKRYPDLAGCPYFVRKNVEETGFQILNEETVSLMGLPVEIVVGQKQ